MMRSVGGVGGSMMGCKMGNMMGHGHVMILHGHVMGILHGHHLLLLHGHHHVFLHVHHILVHHVSRPMMGHHRGNSHRVVGGLMDWGSRGMVNWGLRVGNFRGMVG